jgi:hypothetical protein
MEMVKILGEVGGIVALPLKGAVFLWGSRRLMHQATLLVADVRGFVRAVRGKKSRKRSSRRARKAPTGPGAPSPPD